MKLPKRLIWAKLNVLDEERVVPESIVPKNFTGIDQRWHRWLKVVFDDGTSEFFCGDFDCEGGCGLPKLVGVRPGTTYDPHEKKMMCSALCGVEHAFDRKLPEDWKGKTVEYPPEVFWDHLYKFVWR